MLKFTEKQVSNKFCPAYFQKTWVYPDKFMFCLYLLLTKHVHDLRFTHRKHLLHSPIKGLHHDSHFRFDRRFVFSQSGICC